MKEGIEQVILFGAQKNKIGFPSIYKKDGRYFYVSYNAIVRPLEYKYIDQFSEGYAAVRDKNGKWGYINEQGKEIIPCIYADAKKFSEGHAAVRDKDETCRWGYIDNNNQPKSEFKYYTAYDFSDGLAVVYDGKYFGAINTDGKEVIPHKFNFLGNFENGLAYACINAVYFYVDRNGNYVCDELQKPHTRKR